MQIAQGQSSGFPLPDMADGPVLLNEQLEVDEAQGTINLSVPLPWPRDRTGAAPPVKLTHHGGGNGPLGLGWELTLPAIRRVGDRSLPSYDDSLDQFQLSGVGLLTPQLEQSGEQWVKASRRVGPFQVTRFSPTIGNEGQEIEHWVDQSNGQSRWRVVDRDGRISLYGRTANSRLHNPKDAAQISIWYLEFTWDVNGNAQSYEYKHEDMVGVQRTSPAESARLAAGNIAGCYCKRIRYGNIVSYRPGVNLADSDFRFEIVFDYGEHSLDVAAEQQAWTVRPDPFSFYKDGFEVRTYRLCRRLLVFHRFPQLSEAEQWVGGLELEYNDKTNESSSGVRIQSLRRIGHRSDGPADQPWLVSSPALKIRYCESSISELASPLKRQDGSLLTANAMPKWMDLFGEGIRHPVFQHRGYWTYHRNLGGGVFGAEELVDELPNAAAMAIGTLTDLEHEGRPDYFVATAETTGFHELNPVARSWGPLETIDRVARLGGVAAESLDLTGNGELDAVVSGDSQWVWFANDGKVGHRQPRRNCGSSDGPPKLATDTDLGLFLLDMNGDGLADVVQIRNGDVRYWPNLGYGRFGDAVVMNGAPRFDFSDRFDPQRLRFADLYGTGTTDFVYLGAEEVVIYPNQMGNGFAPPVKIVAAPRLDDFGDADLFDVLADGSLCMVWKDRIPYGAESVLNYLPLMADGPPGQIRSISNGVGEEIRLHFTSSARSYLDDQRRDTPWPAPIPQHRMVVERVDRIDNIAKSTTCESYRYHNGWFDAAESKFIGFGFVERFDSQAQEFYPGLAEEDFVAAAVIRTWYHAGELIEDPKLAQSSTSQFFRGDAQARSLVAATIDPDLIGTIDQTTRSACLRAIAGSPIRKEVHAVDNIGLPFQVSETRYVVRPRQPAGATHAERHAAIMFFDAETLIHVYEQIADDPRIEHTMKLNVDSFGLVHRLAKVAYRRREPHVIHDDQRHTDIQLETTDFANRFDNAAALDVAADSRRFVGLQMQRQRLAVTGLLPSTDAYFSSSELSMGIEIGLANQIDFHEVGHDNSPQARLISWERTTYHDAAGAATDDVLAIAGPPRVHHVSVAAFPTAMVPQIFATRISDQGLIDLGYRQAFAYWWRDGPTHEYLSVAEFSLLRGSTDAFGNFDRLTYDNDRLFVTAIRDQAGITTTYQYDLVAMEPRVRIDANNNRAEVRFDPLGRAYCQSLRGSMLDDGGVVQEVGDEGLDAFRQIDAAAAADVIADPAAAVRGAAAICFYDDLAYEKHLDAGGSIDDATPASVVLVRRTEPHQSGRATECEVLVGHVDGRGQTFQQKRRVGEGKAFDPELHGDQPIDAAERWMCGGRVFKNNKGLALRKFDPFHTTSPRFEPNSVFALIGRPTQFSYDAIGRIVRTDDGKGFFTEGERTAWRIRSFDENDTVERSLFMNDRIASGEIVDPAELEAVEKARAHRDTPSVAHFDPQGRPLLIWAINTDDPQPLETYFQYDAFGEVALTIDPRQRRLNAGRPVDSQVASETVVRDMAGLPLASTNMDRGTVLTLSDVLDRIVHRWDARGQHIQTGYDAASRVSTVHLSRVGDATPAVLVERFEYGDAIAGSADRNQRGRLVTTFDQAGKRLVAQYDLEGRARETQREFSTIYREPLDWTAGGNAEGSLQPTTWISRSEIDALGRVVRHQRPDGSVQECQYGLGGRLHQVKLTVPGAGPAGADVSEVFLQSTLFDAYGRRIQERYGNGVKNEFTFETETGRLVQHSATVDTAGGIKRLIDVDYRYDPVGNLVWRDDRTREHLINNTPHVPAAQRAASFTYDSLYRIIDARAWTHEALAAADSMRSSNPPHAFKGTRHLSLNNGQLLTRYRRRYSYDEAGNLLSLQHSSSVGAFNRQMWVADDSNRSVLLHRPDGSIRPSPETLFDATGNLVALDHLAETKWDFKNQLSGAVIIKRSGLDQFDDAEYYIYDSSGERLRKVEERLDNGGMTINETITFAGCVITQRRRAGVTQLERKTSVADYDGRKIGLIHHWTVDQLSMETNREGDVVKRYLASGHGGHQQLELDDQAGVVAYEEYAPFGDTVFIAGDRVRDIVPRVHRFAGKMRDDVTGFYYFGFRYYAPWMSRWLSPDPIGTTDGSNLYRYVHNNPTTYTDPLGLETEEEQRRATMERLRRSAVPFESLPQEIQRQAYDSWVTASNAGVLLGWDPSTPLQGITPEDLETAVNERGLLLILPGSPRDLALQGALQPIREIDLGSLLNPGETDNPWDATGPPGNSGTSPGLGEPPGAAGADPPAAPPPSGDTGSPPDDVPQGAGVSARAASQLGQRVLPPADVPTPPRPASTRPPAGLPDDALRWGDSGAARDALLQRPEFRNGRVPADFGRTIPDGVRPNQLDPTGPAPGQPGHVAPYNQQRSATNPNAAADYDSTGRRITEREHGAPRGHQRELAHDPQTGRSRYTNQHYSDDITVWEGRDTALDKTHGNRGGAGADNPVTNRLKAERAAGNPIDFGDTYVDARNNYQRSLQATNSATPPRSADIAVFHQMSNMSGIENTADVAGRLPPGAADDIDNILRNMDAGDAFSWAGLDPPRVPDLPNVHIPDVPVPGAGAKALGGLKAGGRVALEALGPLGTGLSLYSFATAKTTGDRILTGADLAADLVGYAGPVGAAFSIGYGVTRAVDEGIGWASREYLGTDLAPTSVIADRMVSVDQTVSRLWADPSKPAYTQTIGWKIAGWLDSL